MVTTIKGDTYHIRYDSLQDFFHNTDPTVKDPKTYSDNYSTHSDIFESGKGSWSYGDESDRKGYYEKRFDPSKGKDMCLEETKKAMASAEYKKLLRQALTYRKRASYQDHGFRLNISKAISGEDRYFTHYKNARKPIVRIAINICGSASVNQEAFRKIAATAIPTIYALEQAGISTEVWYTAFARRVHDTDEFQYTATEVMLKSAQQRFNWTTFAPVFTLGSYRESIFLSWAKSEYEANDGLGRPTESRELEARNNYGYDAVIGLNAVGPVDQVKQLFGKLQKSDS